MLVEDKINRFPVEKGFRLRGLETTRLDTFVDAAFAFATTMLVISVGNIPKSFSDLILAFKGIPSFLASFISIVFIWLGHRRWSRRYGFENNTTIIISFAIIFVLMIYVYPLRLVFSALFSWISGNFFPSEFQITDASELANLFIFYGLGFAAITSLLGFLYKLASRKIEELQLNDEELHLTKYEYTSQFTLTGTAIASALFAFIMPTNIAVYAGFVYSCLPILMPLIAIHFRKSLVQLKNNR
jgi:uncharacterized membrane protein